MGAVMGGFFGKTRLVTGNPFPVSASFVCLLKLSSPEIEGKLTQDVSLEQAGQSPSLASA
jgi:hypothetical protein